MEAHLKNLKKQHATQLQDMQSLLDKQSDQIDSLLAEQQSMASKYTHSKHEVHSVTGQLNSMIQKVTHMKLEAEATQDNNMQLQNSVQILQQAAQTAKQALAAAADRESNLQQEISKLKQELLAASKESELKDMHEQLALQQQGLSKLQAQAEAGAAQGAQRQALLDRISEQQQQLHAQANDVLKLHSQAEVNDLKQREQLEQLKLQQLLIAQLKAEVTHLKGKLCAQQAAADIQQQEIDTKSAQLDILQDNVQTVMKTAEAAAVQHEAMSGLKQKVDKQLAEAKALLQDKDILYASVTAQLADAQGALVLADAANKRFEEQVEHLTELNNAAKDTKASLQQVADVNLSAADKHAHQLAQENISLKGNLKQQQQQLAHLAILEAALAASKADMQKAHAQVAHLEGQLDAITQASTEREKQMQSKLQELPALQAAIVKLEQQLVDAAEKHSALIQQLCVSQAELAASRQQVGEHRHAIAQQQASQLSSQQSIAALQQHVSQDAVAAATSQHSLQALTDQLEVQHEQLQQEKQKLRDALHDAAAAREAAVRLHQRLVDQQAQTADQHHQFSQAVHADSAVVKDLQTNVSAMQGKIQAADQAIAAYKEEAQVQAAKADTAQEQLRQTRQELALKSHAVDSLQATLKAASASKESDALLTNSLQEEALEQEALAAARVKSVQRQLAQQIGQNAHLRAEVQELRDQLAAASHTVAAVKDNLHSPQAQAVHDTFRSLQHFAVTGSKSALQDSTNALDSSSLPFGMSKGVPEVSVAMQSNSLSKQSAVADGENHHTV